jgi:predicted nucleotidyltransferase
VAEGVALEGEMTQGLAEIVSFRGRFADQAAAGQRVRARGSLERLLWHDRPETACLVVGRPGDYLLALDEPRQGGVV